MNKHLAIAAIAIMAFGLTNPVFAAKKSKQTMSFGFGQEFAGVASTNEIRVDFYPLNLATSATTATDIRIGAFGGEVMIDVSSGAGSSGIGYKASINPKMAVYGMLFFCNDCGGGATSATNITAGIAYTTVSNGFVLNGNGEVFSAAGGTTMDLRGAGFYPLKQRKLRGKVYLGAEVDLQMSPSPTTTDIYAGARWIPKKNVMLDMGLIASSGGTTSLATPVMFRLNIGL